MLSRHLGLFGWNEACLLCRGLHYILALNSVEVIDAGQEGISASISCVYCAMHAHFRLVKGTNLWRRVLVQRVTEEVCLGIFFLDLGNVIIAVLV